MLAKVKIKKESPSGFALPLVIILGFILAIGGMTMLARSFGGLIGSVRQQKSREAREAAEIGLAVTMEALNGGYGYLMINCYPNPGNPSSDPTKALFSSEDVPIKNSCFHTGGWGVSNQDSGDREDLPPEFPSSLCPGSRTGYPQLAGSLTIPTMRYRVDYYSFNGTEFYGGSGTIKVTGESLSDDKTKILATSTIQQTFNVITEPCGGFPGLLMIYDGNLGNNDIIGLEAGNIHCVACDIDGSPNQYGMYSEEQLRDAIGAGNKADITGTISIGPIDFPGVPEFPFNELNCIKQGCYTLDEGYDDSPTPAIPNSHNLKRKIANKNRLTVQPLSIGGNNWAVPSSFDFTSQTPSTSPLPPATGAAPEPPGFYYSNDGWRIVAGNTEGALNVARDSNDNYIDRDPDGNGSATIDGTIRDFCIVLPDSTEMITHCLIEDIDVGSKKLTINTTNGPVRLYFKGREIDISGQGGIEHIWTTNSSQPPASRLGFFGIRTDEQFADGLSSCTSEISSLTNPQTETDIQKVTLSGGGGFSHLFGYFPCGITGINGGSAGETVNGVCVEAGDMNGTIWTAYWDGSNSNVAELCVPDGMINQLRYFFGAEFALSVRRYRAQGISDWRGFQGLSQ